MIVAVVAAAEKAFGLQISLAASVQNDKFMLTKGYSFFLHLRICLTFGFKELQLITATLFLLFPGFSLALSSSSESASYLDFAHISIAASLTAIAFLLSFFSAVHLLWPLLKPSQSLLTQFVPESNFF